MHRSIGAITARRRQIRTNDMETQQNFKNCIFGLFVLASIGLVIAGFTYISYEKSAAAQRADLVEPFDEAVEAWRNGLRQDFEKSSYTVTLQYSGVDTPRAVDGQATAMPFDQYKDFLSAEETYHEDLETYQALKYRILFKPENLTDAEHEAVEYMESQSKYLQIPQEWLKEPLPKASHSPSSGSEVIVDPSEGASGYHDLFVETKATMNFTLELTSEDGLTSTHAINNVPVGLARMTRNNFKSCHHRGGIRINSSAGQHCTILLTVSRICLVVSKDANDHWEVLTGNQASCLKQCAYPCQQHANGTLLYMPNRDPLRAKEGAVGKGALEVIVRAAADPYVLAMNITGGTLNFGPSGKDFKTNAIICIVLGTVLAVPAIAHFAIEYLDAASMRRATAYYPDESNAEPTPGIMTARPVIDEPIAPGVIIDKPENSNQGCHAAYIQTLPSVW